MEQSDLFSKHTKLLIYLLLLGITIVGVALRLIELSGNLNADEVWIIDTAVSPFPDFIRETLEDHIHPPLFHFITRSWVYLFGLSDISGRLVALTFGALSILLIYWVGKEVSGSKIGLIAAGLLALSPVHIFHSQYGRHYSLFVFFVLLSMLSFIKLYNQPHRRGYGILFVLSSVLLVYTHYFGWLIVMCEGIMLVFARFRYIRYWVMLGVIVVLSYIPWVIAVIRFISETESKQQLVQVDTFIDWIKPISFKEPFKTLIIFNGDLPILYFKEIFLFLLAIVCLFSLRIVLNKSKNWESILFLFSCIVIPFVIVFLVSYLIQPIWILRAMILSLPAYYLLIAIGSEQMGERVFPILVLILLVWMSLASVNYIRSERGVPYEQIANYIERESEDGIPIIVENSYVMNPLFFYYKGKGYLYELQENNVSVAPVSHKGSLSQILSENDRKNKLILVTYTPYGIEVQDRLSSNYRLINKKMFLGYGAYVNLKTISVFLYERN